jgi:hypothetical protein
MDKKTIDEILNSDEAYKLVELKSFRDLKSLCETKCSTTKSWFRWLLSYWDLVLIGCVNIVCAAYLVFFLRYYFTNDRAYVESFNRVQNEAYLTMTKFWLDLNGFDDYSKEECTVPMPHLMNAITRPVDDCQMCIGLGEIDRLNHITQDDFVSRYAYSAIPVIIEDATANWTAMNVFSFKFFKDLYTSSNAENKSHNGLNSNQNIENTCQFFPYKTKFKNLEDVFELDEGYLTQGSKEFVPWYIGWYEGEEKFLIKLYGLNLFFQGQTATLTSPKRYGNTMQDLISFRTNRK